MRVLISTSTFPLWRDDGLPRFVSDLAEELTRRGEVTVLAPHAPGAPRHERWGALEVERFGYFWPRRWQRLAYGYGIGANLRGSWLARLQLPHESGQGSVSLVERQLAVLREKNHKMSRRLNELMAVARSNHQLSDKVHRLALSLSSIPGTKRAPGATATGAAQL